MADPSVPGRRLRTLAVAGALAMIAALIHGLAGGYLVSQITAIGSIQWGQVLLIDLYVGLALFGAWIVWREGRRPATAGWIAALLLAGNLVACIYVLHALRQAGTSGTRFWHGPWADPR